jgi:hypothetical protein
MFNMNGSSLNIAKASFIMGVWGLVLVLGGVINQWWGLNVDNTLWLWAGVTVLGLVAQFAGLMKGLWLNMAAWLIVLVLGWGFTFYVTKFDNGAHADLYGDLPGVWLILLGLAYGATAFQVDKRFFIIAAIHLVFGALLELSYRQIMPVSFLDSYSVVLFGLVSGLPLIIAALPFWYAKATKVTPAPNFAMSEAYHHNS